MLSTDAALAVEFWPDNGGPALNHRAIYLDVCLVAANGRHAIIAGACLIALERLAAG